MAFINHKIEDGAFQVVCNSKKCKVMDLESFKKLHEIFDCRIRCVFPDVTDLESLLSDVDVANDVYGHRNEETRIMWCGPHPVYAQYDDPTGGTSVIAFNATAGELMKYDIFKV